MADPDAPQRGNERGGPWLHWIQAAFKGNDVNNGKTLGILFSFLKKIATPLFVFSS